MGYRVVRPEEVVEEFKKRFRNKYREIEEMRRRSVKKVYAVQEDWFVVYNRGRVRVWRGEIDGEGIIEISDFENEGWGIDLKWLHLDVLLTDKGVFFCGYLPYSRYVIDIKTSEVVLFPKSLLVERRDEFLRKVWYPFPVFYVLLRDVRSFRYIDKESVRVNREAYDFLKNIVEVMRREWE